MNKRQKEVLENSLENEKQVLKLLEENYIQALKDIKIKIKDLMDSEETQSKIYQINYQKSLEKQIKTILDILQENNITTIQEYLQLCYENTFIGALYDIQGQGIPLTVPINQNQVVNIINTPVDDLKLSERIYENTSKLKKVLKSEIARGISNNYSYWDIARNISSIGQIDLYKAQRIARTEGHRVQEESRYEAQKQAKKKGADIVKQWDSTLDSRTRESHRKLDGQIKELDEPFEINGHKAMYPGKFGRPEEDINCRCVSLQRAKWALDESELEVLKERAAYFGLDKTKSFEEFKTKYLGINSDNIQNKGYNYNKDGTIVVTHDWKGQHHVSIPKEIEPYAVLETDTLRNNGYYQIDRTIYDKRGCMHIQVHSGHHGNSSKHPYGEHGEHKHLFVWKDKKIIKRETQELNEKEKLENKDILKNR